MNINMKILMVLENEFPADDRVEKEIKALEKAGHNVHLACSTRKGLPLKAKWNNTVIHRKPMSLFIHKSSVGILKFPFYFDFWRKHIFRVLEEEKFDAIHIHDLPLIKIGVEAKNRYKILLISDLHENWPALLKYAIHTRTLTGRVLSSNRQWINYERKMLSYADMIITIIEESRERIIKMGKDPVKVIIVSNTVDTESIPVISGKKQDDDFVIYYSGGINRHRGLQVVLEAIGILNNPEIRLCIAGSGSYKKVLEKIAEKSGISGQVKFTGHVSFNEMIRLLADADAAIIPHLRTENNDASSPNKLYQYMYLGKPVISSDCLSLKRIIKETDAGFIYKNDSPAQLAALIETMRSDRQLLERKGINGRNAVLSKYNWKYDSERLIAGYQKLVKK